MKYTNLTNIPLSLAIWLCDDDYDHSNDSNTISTTTLLKPLKAIILARQSIDLDKTADVSSLVPSRMGSALHTAVEESWKKEAKLKENLKSLGYKSGLIDRILINPEPNEINEDSLCIYMEKRSKKKVGKFIVSGKFDFVMQARLEDFKSTGTYNYISGSNKVIYGQQGSIYRWLNQDIIKEDHMVIQYIFTDWSTMKARQDKNYPQSRLQEQKIPLMSIPETEAFVTNIINKITALENSPEKDLPLCTEEELWQKPAVHKYYKDPSKKARSTKNFDNYQDAAIRLSTDGGVGIIDTIPGQVVRCKYCNVIGVCAQAAGYIADGSLVL